MFRAAPLLFVLLVGGGALPPVPDTPKKPVTDTYHDVQVTDDYRWLEKHDDPAVRKWIEVQNKHARAILDKNPALKRVREELATLYANPTSGYYHLQYTGGRLFAMKRQPGKEQPVIVVLELPNDISSERLVIDPNALDAKGKTAIDFYNASRDGKLVAVSLSVGGSEDGTLHVFEVATGKKRTDVLPHVAFPTAGGCVAWDADHAGFCYTRYPRGDERPREDHNFYQQVYHHTLGEPTEKDTYEFGKDLPRVAEIFLDRSHDGEWLLATVQNGDGREFAHHLKGPSGKWRQLTRFDDQFDAVALRRAKGAVLYMLWTKDAPRGKVVRYTPVESEPIARWVKLVVPESKSAIVGLDWQQLRMIPRFVPTEAGLFVLEIDGGPSRVRFFPPGGTEPMVVPLPDVCTVNEMIALNDDEILLQVETFTAPAVWYTYKPGDNALRRSPLSGKEQPGWNDVEVTRVFAKSKDGTEIPMTLLSKKGFKKDGKTPTHLYAYGGYGISTTPHFDVTRRLWLDHGGILAIANIRGGAEYGEEWHKAAMLTKRQNGFDDFFACARLLIDQGYTNPQKLAIEGQSNGGLLMGAALTQHPELFRAVVAHVGVYDMLRFEQHPNGVFNTAEYGSVKNGEQFKALYAYSPLHRVKDGTPYPAVLLLTGTNDGRVDPSNTYKMAARLQAATASKRPVLLRVDFDSGHGLGDSFTTGSDRRADVYAFLFEQLGME